jgi:two-component system response regulator YesN
MIKVIVIDDEPIILDGIQKIIPWEQHGLCIVDVAPDGEIGLAKIKQHLPELVITDIRMKFMDGLALMHEAKKINHKITFIVISAYNDFQYAKEACALGAFSYVLKPVVQEELLDIVIRAKDEIVHNQLIQNKVSTMYALIKEDSPVLIGQFLHSVFHREISGDKITKKAAMLNYSLRANQNFTVVIIKLNMNFQPANQTKLDHITMYAANNIIEEIVTEHYSCLSSARHDDKIELLIWCESSNRGCDMIDRLIHKVKDAIGKYLKAIVCVGKGSMVQGYDHIYKSYQDAVQALQQSLIQGNDSIVGTLDTNVEKQEYVSYPKDMELKIIEDIQLQDEDLLKQDLKHLIDYLKKSTHSYLYISNCLHQLFTSILRSIVEKSSIVPDNYKDAYSFLKQIYDKTTDETISFIYHFCKNHMDQQWNAHKSPHIKKIVREALVYIRNNVQNSELSIREVAKIVHMNPTYFGQVFKKELDKSFNEYLAELRIKEAKRLLLDLDDKVYEIAQRTGFNSTHYFNVLFKKMTGQTPNDYRNQQ